MGNKQCGKYNKYYRQEQKEVYLYYIWFFVQLLYDFDVFHKSMI